MTRNQVSALDLQEKTRANKEKERETRRSNERNEYLKGKDIDTKVRANQLKEKEVDLKEQRQHFDYGNEIAKTILSPFSVKAAI